MKVTAMALVGVLMSHSLVWAQPQTDAWSRLQDLDPGSKVRVTLTDGAQVVGRIVQVTNDVLTLNDVDSPKGPGNNSDRLTISRSDVSEISHLKMPTWAKGIIWGAVGFVILSIAVGAYLSRNSQ